MIIEERVLDLLTLGGFTGAFNDYRARAQPAPIAQLFYFDEVEVPANTRILTIRSTGSAGGNKYVQNIPVSIIFAGKQNKSDAATVADYGDRIITHFLEVRENCGIIEISSINANPTIMYSDSGRPLVELQCIVKIDRGIS